MILNYYLKDYENKFGERPIRISVTINKTRMMTTVGFSVRPDIWDDRKQRVKPHKQNSQKQTSSEINEVLDTYVIRFTEFEKECEGKPSVEDLKKAMQGKIEKKKKAPRHNVMYYYDIFIREESIAAQWSRGTLQTINAFKKHLQDYAGNKPLTYFNDDGVTKLLNSLRSDLNFKETSIQKNYKVLRWFLRWAVRKGYLERQDMYRTQPKIKMLEQPVIFLTKEELLKLYNFQIPSNGTKVKLKDLDGNEYEKTVEDAAALAKTRDLFCFCAFTSLRYSDMANVKRTDIRGDILYTTTQKTNDRLPIDLNSFAKAILDKYKDCDFPGGLALPVISNQKMNDYIKDVCELCEFTEPITKIFIQGGERVEETSMKWQLVSTHSGRKTFICFALASGIPPQVVMKWTGHSDYKAMKPYIDIAEKEKKRQMSVFEQNLMG